MLCRIEHVGNIRANQDGWPIEGDEMKSQATVRAVVGLTIMGGIAAGMSGVQAAGSATADLTISASVINNCVISTTTLAFGPYDPVDANAATDLDGSGVVTVACTKGAAPTIGLGLGNNASGSVRRLSDGSGNF